MQVNEEKSSGGAKGVYIQLIRVNTDGMIKLQHNNTPRKTPTPKSKMMIDR